MQLERAGHNESIRCPRATLRAEVVAKEFDASIASEMKRWARTIK